jgi:hypothetical protein
MLRGALNLGGFFKKKAGKHEEKRQLGRPRRRWEDIIMGLREIGWEVVDCMQLA